MTSSPGLFLRTSTGVLNSACTALPDCNRLALAACALPCLPDTSACDVAAAELLEFCCAPDLSAEAEVFWDAEPPACKSAEVWAVQTAESKTTSRSETIVLFTRASKTVFFLIVKLLGTNLNPYIRKDKMQPVFQLLPEKTLEVSRWEAMICRSQNRSITPATA